jgi:glutamate-1-semialdehyde 2,1-aminomutase
MDFSSSLFERAKAVIPGGVNSPVRAFKGVGGSPIFIDHGEGAYLVDVAGKRYIDYIGSWGPLIVGHSHPLVVQAVTHALQRGMSFGAPTVLEIELAEKIMALMPSIEKIRMVNSGTEATMTAIRLARGFTQKSKIIKFDGCYHGHSDSLLVKAGSGLLTLGIPSCHGILPEMAEHTLVARFNDLAQTRELFKQHSGEIAAVIIEPIAGNMGLVLPDLEFLQGLRQLCDAHHAVLIFDEVMTGFRVALAGAQSIYGVKPDLTTLGKIIGGGMPVGAIGGRADIMACLAPEGSVYQAGTLSGNPLAMAAGLATLSLIEEPGFFEHLSQKSARLIQVLIDAAQEYQVPFAATSVGGMFGFFFREGLPGNYDQVASSDVTLFKRFYHGMLNEGIYFAPSAYEAGFISSVHQHLEIDATRAAAERVFKHCMRS